MTNKQTPMEAINTLISTIRLRGDLATTYETILIELTSENETTELIAMEGLRRLSQEIRKSQYTPAEANAEYTSLIDRLETLLTVIVLSEAKKDNK